MKNGTISLMPGTPESIEIALTYNTTTRMYDTAIDLKWSHEVDRDVTDAMSGALFNYLCTGVDMILYGPNDHVRAVVEQHDDPGDLDYLRALLTSWKADAAIA